MKRTLIIYTLLLFLSILSFNMLFAASLWQEKNIYSSASSLAQGDVVIVDIQDISDMKYNFTLKNNATSTVNSSPDVTITGFLPKVSATKSVNTTGDSEFKSQRKFRLSLAAQVDAVAGPNRIQISGTRTYSVNGVITTLRVSGTIDPKLMSGRTIAANSINNFRLDIITSKGRFPLTRQPLTGEDTAKSELTEQEKQNIIVDYLQKMLGELTQ